MVVARISDEDLLREIRSHWRKTGKLETSLNLYRCECDAEVLVEQWSFVKDFELSNSVGS